MLTAVIVNRGYIRQLIDMMTRRQFALGSAASLVSPAKPSRTLEIVTAPSSLGLRPNAQGREPETWSAAEILLGTGLAAQLRAPLLQLEHPVYEFAPQSGTRIRNGLSIRRFSFDIATHVANVRARGNFPIVLGGDCSILLGCLLGLRRSGGKGLIHVDGHSDYFHPGNYDTSKRLGSVAGMDLALATGRGETILTNWPGIDGPLADESDTSQVGERDAGTAEFRTSYGDIERTKIYRVTIQELLVLGVPNVAESLVERLATRGLNQAWLHVDLDVLDQASLPAVDSPGTPGLDFTQLESLLATIVSSGRIAGMDFTVYDPGLDPRQAHAPRIAQCVERSVASVLVNDQK
jgi:arginase